MHALQLNTSRMHALQHGWHARSLTRLECNDISSSCDLTKTMVSCTLFNTAGMHALQHGWHARSLTRLACTLFNTDGPGWHARSLTRLGRAGMHALQHGWHARSSTRLACNYISSSCDLTKTHDVMHALQHGWHAMTYHHLVI